MERFVRCPGVDMTELEGELFLVPPSDQAIFYLDRIGAALWRLLETPHSRGEILRVFADAFPDVPPERLQSDLDRTLADMRTSGLVMKQT